MAHRTTADGNDGNLYVDLDSSSGIAGTVATMADDMNMKQEEICLTVEDALLTLDSADNNQISKAIIALSKPIGETYFSEFSLTPIPYSAAKTSTSAGSGLYLPIIPRHDYNHDVSTTQVDASVVTAFRDQVMSFNGTSSFSSAVLASGVLTMPSTTAATMALEALVEMGLLNRYYYNDEEPHYEGDGALYSGYRAYTIRIEDVDYQISDVDSSAGTITLSSYPSDGTYTVEFHPFAIYGDTTSFRLRKLSGQNPVGASDVSGTITFGGSRLDQFQDHVHETYAENDTFSSNADSGGTYDTPKGSDQVNSGLSYDTREWSNYSESSAYTYARNGAPRGGDDTHGKDFGVGIYTHVGYLKATTWTNN